MAGPEKVSRVVLTFDGEAGTIDDVLSQIKGRVKSAVADLEATTKKVELFGGLEDKVKASADALDGARARAADLRAELDRVAAAGGKATPELTAAMKATEREVTATTNAYNRQVDAITKLQRQLSLAGVDTSNLARAQLKLAESTKIAADAAAEQSAKQVLGLKTLGDIEPQVAKLRDAYETLRASGKLSATEIAAAQQQLQMRIKELNASVTGAQGGFARLVGPEISGALLGFAARFIGIGAAITTITTAITSAIGAARDYQQGLAEIGSVSNLTKAQLEALGLGVRALATDLGLDLQEGLKAVFDLIRSGVPPENALEVLRVSTEAAKAAITDVGTTAKISTLLFDAFGLEVSQLSEAFDALVQGQRDGGATLKEFSASAGPLLNAGRALGLTFTDIVATLTVMTDASNDASGSIESLTKIVVKLGDPEVRGKIRSLVGETTGLVDTFQKLGAKGLNLQDFLDLGVASTKTAAAIAALTNNTGKLAPELGRVAKSAGAFAAVNKELYNSPKERSERFNAALHETSTQFGLLIGAGSELQVQATNILADFNSLASRFTGTAAAAQQTAPAVDAVGSATKRAGDNAKEAAASLDRAKATLTDFSAKLLTAIGSLQSAGAANLSEIQARAAAEIAALDRSAAATAETAARTIAIQQQAGADRLAEILATEAKVNKAIEDAVAARTKLLESSLKGDRDRETKIAGEVAKIRLDAAQKQLADLRSLLNDELALRNQHVTNVNALEQQRLAFNQGVEQQLFQLRLTGLSAFDQYVAKVQEVERLTALAREQGAKGFIQQATETTNKGIALALSLGKVVNETGQTVVGKYEAQGKALGQVNALQKNLNENIDAQKGLEENAAKALDTRVQDVSTKIAGLQATVDLLKADLARNLILEIHLDEDSIRDANAKIDELARTRTVDLVIRTTKQGATPETPPADLVSQIPRELAGGGFIGPVRRAATGGPMLRRVPGEGFGDSVYAHVPAGSFVLRRAASAHYGGIALGRMLRGYAEGGSVQGFADGGTVNPFPNNYWVEYRGTIAKLRALQEASIGSPRPPSPYIGLGDWAAKAVDEFPFYSKTHRDQIRDLIDQDFDGWLQGIAAARALRVPLTMEMGLSALLRRYAEGGAVDTVPAILTPGEFVFNPQAVAHITRAFGGGFLPALNAMRLDADILGAIAPRRPVAHFAEGGPVGVATMSATRSGYEPAPTSGRTVAGAITLNVYVQRLDEAEIGRTIIPALDRHLRRSR